MKLNSAWNILLHWIAFALSHFWICLFNLNAHMYSQDMVFLSTHEVMEMMVHLAIEMFEKSINGGLNLSCQASNHPGCVSPFTLSLCRPSSITVAWEKASSHPLTYKGCREQGFLAKWENVNLLINTSKPQEWKLRVIQVQGCKRKMYTTKLPNLFLLKWEDSLFSQWLTFKMLHLPLVCLLNSVL